MYNVSAYVERCLLSVMRQTRPANECIIVDDASPDDSIAKCERLIAEYNGPTRFIILHHNEKRGLSATRNTGTDAATCDYIIYVDSDDELTTDCLEKLSQPILKDDSIEMVMGNNKTDCIEMHFSWWQRLWAQLPNDRRMDGTPSMLYSNEEVLNWFYKGKTTRPEYVWNKLLLLKFIKKNQLYNKEGLLYEDRLWSYYLIHCLNRVAFVCDVTYLRHIRPNSIVTSTKIEKKIQHYGIFYEEFAKNIVPGERIEETAFYARIFCYHYIDAHDNPSYQYAYRIFRRELSDGKHRKLVWLLTLTHHLCKYRIGQLLFSIVTQIHMLLLKIYKYLRTIYVM